MRHDAEKIQKIIELRKKKLTYTEIAERCGVTRNAVAGLLYRAREVRL